MMTLFAKRAAATLLPALVTLTLILSNGKAGGQVVGSFSELIPYLDDDNVNVVMTPGTYTIGPDDVTSGLFPSDPINPDTTATLLAFTGNNSTFDFTGVTFEIDTRVFRSFGNIDVKEIAVWGDDLVLKNLTIEDIGTTRPQRTALGVLVDGARNTIEGFNMTVRGSYPYGYGDIFGKGSGYVIKHFKHSAILVRGDDNLVKDCRILHRAYGHGIFCQGSVNARIEGCYLEGEIRTTDEVLAEAGTGSAADDVVPAFNTVWGFPLRAGDTFSLQEDGIRAYNKGPGPDGIERDTTNMEVVDCTVKNMRSGVTIGFCNSTKLIQNCVTLGCENGYWPGGGDIVGCAGDAQIGALLQYHYQNDSNSDVDLTVLESEGAYTNDYLAYIVGSGHDITFRNPDIGVNQNLEVVLGGPRDWFRWDVTDVGLDANNMVLSNLSNYPLNMTADSSGTTGQSWGAITDNGSSNSVSTTTVNSCGGFSLLRTVEAEDYCGLSGSASTTTSGGRTYLTGIKDGDWVKFDDFFFGCGPTTFEASVSSGYGGDIELRLGSAAGTLIGTCSVAPGANPELFFTATSGLTLTRGVHDLFLVFKGAAGALMSLDSFKFTVWETAPEDREARHLMAHWPFDEGAGGIAYDASGNGHDGTVTGATWTSGGFRNGALSFDSAGDNDWVDIPSAIFDDIETEITVSFMSYGGSLQPAQNSAIYAQNGSGQRILNVHLPFDNSNVYWDAGGTGGYDRVNKLAASSQFKGQWNYWTFVKNVHDGEMKVYCNGKLFQAEQSKSQLMSDVVTATIGARLTGSSYDGLLDEVRIYDAALTENEVKALYENLALNAAPEAAPLAVSVRRDSSVATTLTATDAEGDAISYTVATLPTSGSLSGVEPDLTYTPNPGFTGTDSFTFYAEDGQAAGATATVTIQVLDGDLIAHWAMNEFEGTQLSDSSGNNHHATLISATRVAGVEQGALSFNGVSDLATLPVSAFNQISDQVSISLWVWGDANQPADDTLFRAVDTNGDRVLNAHLPWGNSQVYWDAGQGSGYDRVNKVAAASQFMGDWNHWVFSKDVSNGIMRIFHNGTLWLEEDGKTRSLLGITEAVLGGSITGDNYAGIIDEVMLFDHALLDTEVSSLQSTYTGVPPFVTWTSTFPSLSDTSWEGDPDGDGIATGLEFILNGNPTLQDQEILPDLGPDGDDYVFTFNRRADAGWTTSLTFEFNSDLGAIWSSMNITNPKDPAVTLGPVVGDSQSVTVGIDESLAPDGRLFGRLKAENLE
ncbi:LamG-like jellyroll fold domain-containing protein [Haloferula sp.]|uniref:LamG-like jellyroll fold domain-containing protein n=1 Tax=Haloferula sp. TaxID=2497595 RepID=UPI00329C91E3